MAPPGRSVAPAVNLFAALVGSDLSDFARCYSSESIRNPFCEVTLAGGTTISHDLQGIAGVCM